MNKRLYWRKENYTKGPTFFTIPSTTLGGQWLRDHLASSWAAKFTSNPAKGNITKIDRYRVNSRYKIKGLFEYRLLLKTENNVAK